VGKDQQKKAKAVDGKLKGEKRRVLVPSAKNLSSKKKAKGEERRVKKKSGRYLNVHSRE